MKRFALRLTAVALGALVVLPVGAASAQPPVVPGKLAVLPAHGTDQSAITIVTAAACRQGTNVIAKISGPGFPAGGQNVVGNTAVTAFEHTSTGGLVIPVSLILRDIANLPMQQVTYRGTYTVTVTCRDRVRLPALAAFAGTLTFRDPHTYTAANPALATEVAPLDVAAAPAPATGPGSALASPPGPGTAAVAPLGAQGALPAASKPVSRSFTQSRQGSWLDWAGPVVLAVGAFGLLLSFATALRRRTEPPAGVPAQATPSPVTTHSTP